MVKPEKPQEKTVSVTLDARLLELAREAEIDLSATLRAALIGEVNAFAIERWKKQIGLGYSSSITSLKNWVFCLMNIKLFNTVSFIAMA